MRRTGKFLYDPACKCVHCKESLPWRMLIPALFIVVTIALACG